MGFKGRVGLAFAAGLIASTALGIDDAALLQVPLRRIGTLVSRLTPDPKDDQWMIGCEVLDRDYACFDNYKDKLSKLGIRTIRLQCGWAKCERVRGEYDFDWLDRQVDFALSHGLNPVLETDYGNPLYKGGGGRDLAAGFPSSEEGLAAWDRWVDALTRHFAGRVRDWAMWNEPDIGRPEDPSLRGKHHSPENIAAFNVRTARIVRKNIPDARIGGLSLGSLEPSFHEACYRALGKDVALFWRFIHHGYDMAPESSYGRVEELQRICARYAPHATVWQAESGAPSEMPGSGLALHHVSFSEISQAKWNLRRMLGDYIRGIPSSIFTICDYYHPGRGIGNYGLLRADSKHRVIAEKRAYHAVRRCVSVFDSAIERPSGQNLHAADSSIVLREFKRKGVPLFLFWRPGEWVCTGNAWDKTAWKMDYRKPGDDCRTGITVLEFDGPPIEHPVWVDLLAGGVYDYPAAHMLTRTDGVTLIDVPIYDSPCLLTGRAAVEVEDCGK